MLASGMTAVERRGGGEELPPRRVPRRYSLASEGEICVSSSRSKEVDAAASAAAHGGVALWRERGGEAVEDLLRRAEREGRRVDAGHDRIHADAEIHHEETRSDTISLPHGCLTRFFKASLQRGQPG